VGYFDGDDADSIKAFRAVANAHHQEHVFGLCTDQSLADVEVVRCPGIVVYKDFDERKTYLQDRNTNKEEAIWSFVSSASMPLIMDIRPEIHDDLIQVSTTNPTVRLL
jgi:hypothetical protein